MGRMVAVEEFRGFEALRLEERLRQAEEQFGSPAVRLRELVDGMTLGRPTESFRFAAADNAVYIPLVGISDVVTSQEDMTLKAQNYALSRLRGLSPCPDGLKFRVSS